LNSWLYFGYTEEYDYGAADVGSTHARAPGLGSYSCAVENCCCCCFCCCCVCENHHELMGNGVGNTEVRVGMIGFGSGYHYF